MSTGSVRASAPDAERPIGSEPGPSRPEPDRSSRGTARRPTRRRLLLLVVVALAAAGAIAWDARRGGDDAPEGASQPLPTLVDVVAPTRRPDLPPQAQQATEDGATMFVRYWFDALNWSLDTADSDLLAGVTGAGCQQCSGWLIGINRWRDAGSELTGGLTAPVELAIGPFSDVEPVQFRARFLTTPATLTAADGSTTEYSGGLTEGGVTVLWANGRWQMTEVVLGAPTPPPSPTTPPAP